MGEEHFHLLGEEIQVFSGSRHTLEAGLVVALTSIQSLEKYDKTPGVEAGKKIGNNSVYLVPRKSQWFGVWAGALAGTHGN